MTAKSSAQRIAEMRAKRKAAGLVHVDLDAHPDDAAEIKAYAAKLAEKRAKTAPR